MTVASNKNWLNNSQSNIKFRFKKFKLKKKNNKLKKNKKLMYRLKFKKKVIN